MHDARADRPDAAPAPARLLASWRIRAKPGGLAATQKAIAATLGTDPAVIDPPRIMRLAGTINWPKPKKLAKGYVAELVTLRVYDTAERPPISSERMARAFAAKHRKKPSFDTGDDSKTADDYAELLRRARTDGEKHGGVRDLAASLAGQGVSRAMAEAIIREACPIWDAGVERLINTAYEKFYRRGGEEVEAEANRGTERDHRAATGSRRSTCGECSRRLYCPQGYSRRCSRTSHASRARSWESILEAWQRGRWLYALPRCPTGSRCR